MLVANGSVKIRAIWHWICVGYTLAQPLVAVCTHRCATQSDYLRANFLSPTTLIFGKRCP